jgi:hypothetical protein
MTDLMKATSDVIRTGTAPSNAPHILPYFVIRSKSCWIMPCVITSKKLPNTGNGAGPGMFWSLKNLACLRHFLYLYKRRTWFQKYGKMGRFGLLNLLVRNVYKKDCPG